VPAAWPTAQRQRGADQHQRAGAHHRPGQGLAEDQRPGGQRDHRVQVGDRHRLDRTDARDQPEEDDEAEGRAGHTQENGLQPGPQAGRLGGPLGDGQRRQAQRRQPQAAGAQHHRVQLVQPVPRVVRTQSPDGRHQDHGRDGQQAVLAARLRRAAGQQCDADEADEQPGRAPAVERLPQHEVRQERGKQGRGRIENRQQAGAQVQGRPAQQQEGQGGEGGGLQQQAPRLHPQPTQLAVPGQQRQQDRGRDAHPQGDERRRSEGRHGGAREQVGRTPEQAQQQEVAQVAGAHDGSIGPGPGSAGGCRPACGPTRGARRGPGRSGGRPGATGPGPARSPCAACPSRRPAC
jgi:hypothetical protein